MRSTWAEQWRQDGVLRGDPHSTEHATEVVLKKKKKISCTDTECIRTPATVSTDLQMRLSSFPTKFMGRRIILLV